MGAANGRGTSVLNEGALLGDYEILRVAGIGGMGVVYRARQRSLDRVVALKVIRDEIADTVAYRERFMREARLAASVDHPHVVSVFGVGEYDGRLALAMQWIEGQDLRTMLERSGRLSPDRAVRLVSQVAGALDAVHSVSGLIHRDVKPSNVLIRDVRGNEHAYLTDFGVARPSDSRGQMTQTGTVIGTTGYMSPEQIRGAEPGPRSDLYALGCLFFEAVTGEQPFQGDNEMAVRWAHANDPRPLPSAFNPWLGDRFDEFMSVALAVNPEQRFRSGRKFADALRTANGDSAQPSPFLAAQGNVAPPLQPPAAHGDVAAQPPTVPAAPGDVAAQPPTVPAAHGDVAAQPPTVPAAPGDVAAQSIAAPHEPTVVGPSTPLPYAAAQTPQPQAAAYHAPAYQAGGYGTPPPPPQPSRRGSPLALILLGVVALTGIAAGALIAAGVFSHKGGAQTITSETRAGATTGSGGHRSGSRGATHSGGATNSGSASRSSCGGDLSVGPDTSCPFAHNVEQAYDHSSGGNTVVTAYSPVTGDTYAMRCTGGTPHVCTGGNNASVYFTSGPTAGSNTSAGGLRACDQNISANSVTSCPFAENTFRAYTRAYKQSGGSGDHVVSVYSPVTGSSYTMNCTTTGGTVNCSGGNNAFVTFPIHAVRVY